MELLGQLDGDLHLVSLNPMAEYVGHQLCQLLEGLGAYKHLHDKREVETLDTARNISGTMSSRDDRSTEQSETSWEIRLAWLG